ncbi:MAG TPA: hypothetical protein VIU65_03615 [Pyrinomonadaceae bacterium]
MKSILRQPISLILILSFASILFAQKTPPPTFKNYPADVYAGKPVPVNLRSHRLARMFRTRIRAPQQEEGINFAGHYTLAVMGCGTGCSIAAMIDARDGRAYFPRVFEGWTSDIGDYQFGDNEDIRTFHADSRLIRVVGRPRISADERWGPSGVYYYEWNNNALRQVHFQPAGSYPKADRP